MSLRSEDGQLISAWRALDGEAENSGWKVIDLFNVGNCKVMAGRRGPDNGEGLLVGIMGASAPADTQLPRGQGFTFVHIDLPNDTSDRIWFALVRQHGGQLTLFSLMATDLLSLLEKVGRESGEKILAVLMARIRAWQDFMKRGRSGVLSAEEEVGLIGELVVLGNLISDGLAAADAVEAWTGPIDGLHDFTLGTGGIEVKSTVLPAGFMAKIGNLDQLDNSLYRPLYVGAVRLGQSDRGKTLPDFIDALESEVKDESASAVLSSKLVAAGYIAAMRSQYIRCFVPKELSYRLVKDDSPRLTRATVPAAVQEARYTMDLDTLPVVAKTFNEISSALGVQARWN